MDEQCDHYLIAPVQLGDYYECEICGLIFPKEEYGKTIDSSDSKLLHTDNYQK